MPLCHLMDFEYPTTGLDIITYHGRVRHTTDGCDTSQPSASSASEDFFNKSMGTRHFMDEFYSNERLPKQVKGFLKKS